MTAQHDAPGIRGWLPRPDRPLLIGLAVAAMILLALDLAPVKFDGRTVEALKYWIGLLGIVLVVVWRWIPRKVAIGALISLTALAGMNYARFSPRLWSSIDTFDTYHYYLGAKYFDEVGYYDLNPASVLADAEAKAGPHNRGVKRYRSQTEKGYRPRPIEHALKRGKQVRDEKFSPARWQAFSHDFLYIQRECRMGRGSWKTILMDRGFNAPPFWIAVARPVASIFPVEWIEFVCLLDILLLLAALTLVSRAYGRVTALWAAFFTLASFSLRWPELGGCFLRFVWISCLMAAMALIKLARPVAAGVCTGLAGMVNVFPWIFLFGPAGKGMIGLFGAGKTLRKRFDQQLLKLAGGALIAAAVLAGWVVLTMGTRVIDQFQANIVAHIQPEELSSKRAGFAIGYVFDGELKPRMLTKEDRKAVRETADDRRVWVWLILLPLAWGLRRKPTDEAFAFGFVPFFLLTTFSHYYAVCRVLLVVVHASDLSRLRNRVGLIALLGLDAYAGWSLTRYPGHWSYVLGMFSWGATAYCAGMTAWVVIESHTSDGVAANANSNLLDPPD